jgi:hypothetical protein
LLLNLFLFMVLLLILRMLLILLQLLYILLIIMHLLLLLILLMIWIIIDWVIMEICLIGMRNIRFRICNRMCIIHGMVIIMIISIKVWESRIRILRDLRCGNIREQQMTIITWIICYIIFLWNIRKLGTYYATLQFL